MSSKVMEELEDKGGQVSWQELSRLLAENPEVGADPMVAELSSSDGWRVSFSRNQAGKLTGLRVTKKLSQQLSLPLPGLERPSVSG